MGCRAIDEWKNHHRGDKTHIGWAHKSSAFGNIILWWIYIIGPTKKPWNTNTDRSSRLLYWYPSIIILRRYLVQIPDMLAVDLKQISRYLPQNLQANTGIVFWRLPSSKALRKRFSEAKTLRGWSTNVIHSYNSKMKSSKMGSECNQGRRY
jgi:hypothetical protein